MGDDLLHIGNGGTQAREDRPADDAVPDVQFMQPGQRGNGSHVPDRQPMSRIEVHALSMDEFTCPADLVQLGLDIRVLLFLLVFMKGMGIGAGMYFTDIEAAGMGSFHLGFLSVDEGADPDATLLQGIDDLLEFVEPAHDIESTLGRDLLPTLGDQHGHVGPCPQRDINHFRGGRNLKVQGNIKGTGQLVEVTVLDVPAIFPEVNRDAVCSSKARLPGSLDWIRFPGPSGLADSGNVVDVYTEGRHAWYSGSWKEHRM